MKLRTKLLLCFFLLSLLIIIVGMIFYVQLRNLIYPLTPESIPLSVEKLENSIDKLNYIYHLYHQQNIMARNLEDYVLNNNKTALQDYYMNQALFEQWLEKSKKIDPALWEKLNTQKNLTTPGIEQIIKYMQENNFTAARQLLASNNVAFTGKKTEDILNQYYTNLDPLTNENALVTVKLAAKHTINILLNSMNKTVIIFFDAIAISILFAFFVANMISRPLHLLRNDIEEEISKKSIAMPVNPSLLSLKGEIGDLARSFGKLITTLRTTTVSRDKLLEEVERRKQTENELRETAKRLGESNQELDQFAYSASHDLRAPLKGIETLSEWINNDCYDLLPEKSRRHLDLLKNRVRRLDGLISGILEYSRAGRTSVNMESVDINKLLTEIIDSLEPQGNINISIDMHMPTVTTDKTMLTQVFMNLISNAIKFHDKPKGEIHIGYEPLPDYYKFYVKDNGPGIDKKFHEKIFEVFQTLQPRDSIESAGIGLALVKKIVEKQGGTIGLQSVLGEGSTFYFTLPKQALDNVELK